jgi:acyl carrier protein
LQRLQRGAEQQLVTLLATEINLAEEEIEIDEPFETYGVDSVVAAKLLSRLEQCYGELPIALMLEQRTIAAIAQYLVAERPERMRAHHEQQEGEASPYARHREQTPAAAIALDG